MKKYLISCLIFFGVFSAHAKKYQISEAFWNEMLCLSNIGQAYCQKWINSGPISLLKYRMIEQSCISGNEFLCTYVVYVQEKSPTPVSSELLALAEYGCHNQNGVHCMILASLNTGQKEEYLKKGCELKIDQSCKKLSLHRQRNPSKKVKFNKKEFEKNIKDAFNKFLRKKN